jgi:hypothetical protein
MGLGCCISLRAACVLHQAASDDIVALCARMLTAMQRAVVGVVYSMLPFISVRCTPSSMHIAGYRSLVRQYAVHSCTLGLSKRLCLIATFALMSDLTPQVLCMSRHLLCGLSGVFWVSVASHMYVASATLCCDYSILLAELSHRMVLHYSGLQSLYMGRGGRCMHCARYLQELL